MTTAPDLDATLHALANPTRRAVVERLGRGPATVSELAAPFDMALPSFVQHLQVLERCGLVVSEKHGRIRVVSLRPERLDGAADWFTRQRAQWSARLDRLEAYVATLESPDDEPA
ncbi:MAG: helix-turn-helix transcriptional regulator [Alphaproteobacteria bacterium]|nr:helix-turn-helix transcriptional regulator [Alphaproteobacteria bacterium]